MFFHVFFPMFFPVFEGHFCATKTKKKEKKDPMLFFRFFFLAQHFQGSGSQATLSATAPEAEVETVEKALYIRRIECMEVEIDVHYRQGQGAQSVLPLHAQANLDMPVAIRELDMLSLCIDPVWVVSSEWFEAVQKL